MNRYILNNVWKNIKVHKVAYIFFTFQIAISFVILSVFNSIGSSVSVDYDNIKNDVTAKSIMFSFKDPNATQFSIVKGVQDNNIKYEDYEYLKSKYSDVLSVSYVYRQAFATYVDGVISTLNAFFVTDEFFYNGYYNPNIKNFEQGSTIYAPKYFESASSDLERYENTPLGDFLENDELKNYSFKDINSIYNGKTNAIHHSGDTYYERRGQNAVNIYDAIIIPISLYNPSIQTSDLGECLLSINFYKETDSMVFKEIIQYFEQKYGNDGQFECEYKSVLAEAKTYISSQVLLAETFSTIAYVCLAIVGVGFIGLILVIFDNRIKKMAISLVKGARYNQLYLESVLEIEAIMLLGVAVGGIATYFTINALDGQITAINIKTDYLMVLYLVAGIILSGIVMSFIVLNRIKKISPTEVLKKD